MHMRGRASLGRAAAAAMILLAACNCAQARVGGELRDLEWLVDHAPGNLRLRRQLAHEYEARGLLEDALEQYLAVASRDPTDEGARRSARALVEQRMPAWLPREASDWTPFARELLELPLGARGTASWQVFQLLVTTEAFPGPAGGDPLERRRFTRADYGYVWEQEPRRWMLKARVHWDSDADRGLAQAALRITLALYCAARHRLACDPVEASGAPVDVWLTVEGEPGARALGAAMYLYSIRTPRPPEEWVREIAHEYGHICLPGIRGFTDTDDPWADGHLGELLFSKWLTEGCVPSWMPWSVASWEREAAERRSRLIGDAARHGFDAALLAGRGAEAMDHFLGLALLVEERAGPAFLGEALRESSGGRPADFAAAVDRLAAARGLRLWNPPPATEPTRRGR